MLISLGQKLALTILAFMCLFGLILTLIGYQTAGVYLEEQRNIRVQHLLNAINYTTEHISGNPELIQIINLFSAEPDVHSIVLAMGDPLTVVASSRSQWLDKPINALPGDISKKLSMVTQGSSVVNLGLDARSKVASFGQRIMLAREEDGGALSKGAILLQMDNAGLEHSKQKAGYSIFGLITIFSITLFILLYFLLKKLVLRPVGAIVSAMANRAQGKNEMFAPVPDSEDEIAQIAKVLNYMLFNQDRAQKEIVRAKDTLEEYLSVTGALIVKLDTRCRIQLINQYGCKLLGYSEAEMIGENWCEKIIPTPKKAEARLQLQTLFTEDDGNEKVHHFENEVITKSGEMLFISWRSRVQLGRSGERIGVLNTGIDITRRKRMELELFQSEHRLLVSEKIAHIGSWEWNIATGEVDWTDEIYRIFGLQPQEFQPTYAKFLATIHPDDRDLVVQAVNAAVANPNATYAIEHRIIVGEGELRYVKEFGEVFRNEQGGPIRMIGAVHDITEQKKIQQALIHAHDELEKRVAERTADLDQAKTIAIAANNTKSEFLARMSHELRTPLNAILGFSQLLLRDNISPAQHKAVEEIDQGGHHLLDLINDILDLSRIDAGQLEIKVEPVLVRQSLLECLSLTTVLLERKEINVVYDGIKLSNVHILADSTRLKQILLNLLSNAIKFNREKGTILISYETSSAANRTRIVIRDTGVGMEEKNLSKLFQPFERLGLGLDAVEGTGIGLALCKRLIEVMDGSIGVNSTVGIGSAFWIELPTAFTCEKTDEKTENNRKQIKSDRHRYQLLYIEDSPSSLKLVEHLLDHRKDIKLLAASRPELGLQMASVYRPDLILLDINLPGMDGFEVLKSLRDNAELRHTNVIAVSANAMREQVTRGMKEGFNQYITKPLNIKYFLDVLEEYLPFGKDAA